MSVLELIFLPIFILVEFIFSIIPRIIFPENFVVAMATLTSLVLDVGFFVPLGTVATIMLLGFTWFLVKFCLRLFIFVVRKVPFLNIR